MDVTFDTFAHNDDSKYARHLTLLRHLLRRYVAAETDERTVGEGKVVLWQKLVCGEPEMKHRCSYFDSGEPKNMEITMTAKTRQILFAEKGESAEQA